MVSYEVLMYLTRHFCAEAECKNTLEMKIHSCPSRLCLICNFDCNLSDSVCSSKLSLATSNL